MYLHLLFKFEKVKVCHGKVNNSDIGDQKSMINLNQLKTTIWAKHNTQWKWSKTLKMITLV